MSQRRKLAAILFADIVGYTRQMNDDEVRGLERRRQFENLAKSVAASHSGRVVKMIGDAAMLEFTSAVDAVSAALSMQRQMADLGGRLGTDEKLQARVGVHVGDVVEEDGDLFGNAVNIAQRVYDTAQPGGICITRDVYVQIRPIMKLRCEPARRKPGKPMPEPIEVLSIIADASDTLSANRACVSGLVRNSRPLAAILAISLIALAHIAVYAFDYGRAQGIQAALPALTTDSDGVFLLIGKGLEDVRVMVQVDAGGPVVGVRTFKPNRTTEARWLSGAPMTEAAMRLSKTLGAERETLAVVTEDWMRNAPLSVRLQPRSTIPYLAGLLPHTALRDRVRVAAGRTEEAPSTPPVPTNRPSSPAAAAPADAVPFAVAGGRYAPGESVPIGGRNLGTDGVAFLGGMQMTVRHWSHEGIVAVVPQNAQPGTLRIVVVPEDGRELDAGTVTIVPAPAQNPTVTVPPAPPAHIRSVGMPAGYRELLAGDLNAASMSTATALRLAPDDLGALAMHAITRALSGDLKGARQSMDRTAPRSRNARPLERGLVLLARAVIADRSNATADADAAYLAAIDSEPRVALPYLLWARSLLDRREIVRARQVLRTGVRNTRGDAWASRAYRDLAERLGLGNGQSGPGVGPRQ